MTVELELHMCQIIALPEQIVVVVVVVVVVESELHMCQRISLREQNIQLLLSQSCICARKLTCRKTAQILGHFKQLSSRRSASPSCRQ